MKKIIIKEDFLEIFPDIKIGIIVAKNINNKIIDENKYRKLLDEAAKEGLKFIEYEEFAQNRVISVWREAFRKFKTKSGVRSSIESLLKRVSKGNQIPIINPLVDIYNIISLKYAMPCGSEDIDKIEGNVLLTKADGTEQFITLGSEESATPYENEIVYKDDKGAICRCWNWREAVRTMITEDSKNVFLCMELIDLSREVEFKNALNELSNMIKENLKGETSIHILDKDNREVIIEE